MPKTKKLKRIKRTRKKELIFPLYFGWQIKVALSKIKRAVVLFYNSFALEKVKNLRNHIVGPFKKYWQYITVVVLQKRLICGKIIINMCKFA